MSAETTAVESVLKPVKNLGGRSSILTDEIAQEICTDVENMLPVTSAAWGAGICERTYFNWIQRGEEDIEAGKTNSPHARFVQGIKRAQTAAQNKCLRGINGPKPDGQWTRFAWLLERLWPDKFAKCERLQHSVAAGEGTTVNIVVQFGGPENRKANNIRQLAPVVQKPLVSDAETKALPAPEKDTDG